MNLTLVRHAYLNDCTLGRLFVGSLELHTLEEGWRADPDGPGGQRRQPGITESCVPDGTYILRPHVSPKYPQGVWALVNPVLGVWYQPGEIPAGQRWGRSAILIHAGNDTDDIEGCVLVGRRQGIGDNRHLVLESRNALTDLRAILSVQETHALHIRPTAGTTEAP